MRRQAAIVAAGLALALSACGGGGDRAPAPAVPSSEGGATPPGQSVRFRAADGRPVAGVFRPAGEASPAVVLVNGLVGGMQQWDAFAPHLHDAGVASLAFEGRGGVDATALAAEVAGAVAFLRGRPDVDPRRVAVVGSSIGGATAVLAMTGPLRRRLRAAVAISPPTAAPLEALIERGRYRPRHVLFLTDHRERASVESLTRGAIDSRLAVSEEVGHGVILLASATNRRLVLDWLARHLRMRGLSPESRGENEGTVP